MARNLTKKRMRRGGLILTLLFSLGLGGMSFARLNAEAQELWHEGPTIKAPVTSPFVALAKKLSPAVVHIQVTKTVETPAMPRGFFFEFGHPNMRRRQQEGSGSGFIIREDGYVVTNHHVIKDATEIVVRLTDDGTYVAEVIGSDPKTDLALLKLKDSPSDLPTVPLGDSDSLQIGEWVMAIGNPYGLEHTVTVGIVSAKKRYLGTGSYDDFIQTDASINPGNSGGPLFNTAGEVVGINTAIIPGGQGLGFAVPVNMAKAVLPQLLKTGRVQRALLGVNIQKIDPALAKKFGMERAHGALVSSVMEGSAAEEAGIVKGDIILRFDGREIKEMRELPFIVAQSPTGVPIEITILRDGKEVSLKAKLQPMPRDGQDLVAAEQSGPSALKLGIQVRTSRDEAGGLLVLSVEPGSPADKAGLRRGDVIREAERKPIASASDLQEILNSATDSLLFLVERSDGRGRSGNIFLVVKLDD